MRDELSLEDVALLRRVAAGDGELAMEKLYRRYERPLYVFGFRLLRDPELADELVQETFFRLWRTAGRYHESRGTVAAYLFAIARHRAVDLWRRPSSRPFEPESEADVAAGGDVTEDMLTRLVVDEALAALSRPHREVLLLSYRGDLTQTAIAEVLGIPLGTVKTRSYHALRALRGALAEKGVHGASHTRTRHGSRGSAAPHPSDGPGPVPEHADG
jgi:RNA polymerase sigma-70 factor, ECF subfamily